MKVSMERVFPFVSLASLFCYFLFDGMVMHPGRRILWLGIVFVLLVSDFVYRFVVHKIRKEDSARYFTTALGVVSFLAILGRDLLDFGYRAGINQEASTLPKVRDFLLLIGVIGSIGFLVQTIVIEVGRLSLEAQSDLSKTKRSLVQNAILGLLVVLPLVVVANYFAILRNYNYDLSSNGKYSLHPVSRTLLKGIEKEVSITAFYPRPLEADGPENSLSLTRVRPDLEIILDQVKAQNSKVTVQFVNADVETDRLQDFGQVSNGVIHVRSPKESLLAGGTPYLEEKIYVRESSDLAEFERKLISAIFTVTTKEKKAYFTTSNGERYGAGFRNVPNEQINKFVSNLQFLNFKIQEWSFAQGWPTTLPEDADILFVIGPTVPFSSEAQDALKKFVLEKNGKLFVTIEPNGNESFAWLTSVSGLRWEKSVLGEVNDKPGFIVAKTFSPNKSTELLPKKDLGVVFPYSGYLQTESTGTNPFAFRSENLLESGGNSYVDKNSNGKLDGEEKRENLVLSVVLNPVTLDENKTGKILLHSGTSWITDQFFGYNMNSNFALAISSGLFLDTGISGIPPKKDEVQTITLSDNQKLIVWAIGVFLFPGLIVVSGSYYVALRRKRS